MNQRVYEEDNTLMACVDWCDGWFKKHMPHLLVKQTNSKGATRSVSPLVHTKNEKKRTPQAGLRDKKKGVRAGYPDIILNVPRAVKCDDVIIGYFPFLAIEMKSAKGNLTINQKHWRDYFMAIGAQYHICRSIKEFQNVIIEYMI